MGDNIAQEFDSLGSEIWCQGRQAGHVTARPRKTRDDTRADRIPYHRKDDRDEQCCLLCQDGCWGSVRENNIDLEPDEVGCDLGVALATSLGPAILDRDIATLRPAEYAQSLHKSGSPLKLDRRRVSTQEPDGRQLRWLLRARCERPCRSCAAEQRKELAAGAHSITSSARCRKGSGIMGPSASPTAAD